MTEPAEKPSKRKAWVYEAPQAPTLADFRAGGEQRQRFLRYWVRENLTNAVDIGMFFALKLVPARVCSGFGAWLGRRFGPGQKTAWSRARANLTALKPDSSPAEIESLLGRYAESQGRQLTEYSVVRRLARGKVRFVGTEDLAARCATGPVIFIGMHLSNWEVLWQCLINMGQAVTTNYDPPQRRSHHWIVNRVRKAGGLGLLPPGVGYVRPALRILESGGKLLIFCDEGFRGRIRAPFFDREAHLESNYALVARMARKANALICPVYLTRDAGVRFTFTALQPFHLPPEERPGSRLMEDVLLLNGIVEPIVRRHPEQWYFIDNRMRES